MMGTPHKYADVIKAWADGAEIQYRDTFENWNTWKACTPPSFSVDNEWRVKPEVRRGKYRVALRSDTPTVMYTHTVETADEEKHTGIAPNFVRWLTNWVEYEY